MSENTDNEAGQVIDGETGLPVDTPPPDGPGTPHRRIDLSSLRDVRLELAALYRKMDRGTIKSQEGTRRAYVLKMIADVIALAELEQRVEELEQLRGGAAARAVAYQH